MLNRGPYIVAAVRILGNILARMQTHHEEKNSMLRRASSGRRLFTRAHDHPCETSRKLEFWNT